jgi:hypothetical protein
MRDIKVNEQLKLDYKEAMKYEKIQRLSHHPDYTGWDARKEWKKTIYY